MTFTLRRLSHHHHPLMARNRHSVRWRRMCRLLPTSPQRYHESRHHLHPSNQDTQNRRPGQQRHFRPRISRLTGADVVFPNGQPSQHRWLKYSRTDGKGGVRWVWSIFNIFWCPLYLRFFRIWVGGRCLYVWLFLAYFFG